MTDIQDDIEGMPRSVWETRFNGKKWRYFDIDNGFAVVTDAGQKLIREHPTILEKLAAYKRGDPKVRRYFKSGGHADLYEIPNTNVLIKEADIGDSIPQAIERMDYLYDVIDITPDWIRLPEHYGAIVSTNLRSQYLIMQKVNGGMSAEEFLKSDSENEETKTLVRTKLDEAKKLLDSAIKKHVDAGEIPRMNLLPDWAPKNVVIDFDTPTQELPFTMWIIDQ